MAPTSYQVSGPFSSHTLESTRETFQILPAKPLIKVISKDKLHKKVHTVILMCRRGEQVGEGGSPRLQSLDAEGRVAFRGKKLNSVLNSLAFKRPGEHPSIVFQQAAGHMSLQIARVMGSPNTIT